MSAQQPEGRLLTAEEVADRLRVARAFVYRHAEQLGAFKVGSHLRFRESEVEEWLSSQRVRKPEPEGFSLAMVSGRVGARSSPDGDG